MEIDDSQSASYSPLTIWQYRVVAFVASASVGSGFGCTKRLVSLVYCSPQVEVVPHTFLAFPGQTDVGISGSLQSGFGFFGHPKAAPAALPCG